MTVLFIVFGVDLSAKGLPPLSGWSRRPWRSSTSGAFPPRTARSAD